MKNCLFLLVFLLTFKRISEKKFKKLKLKPEKKTNIYFLRVEESLNYNNNVIIFLNYPTITLLFEKKKIK